MGRRILVGYVSASVCLRRARADLTPSGRPRRHVLGTREVRRQRRKRLTPDDRSKYTVTFEADGRVSARVDCNRGTGTWTSSGPTQLQFGPLAVTRMMCSPAQLNDHIPKHWEYVRSYILKDSHLFLSLMADGGIYEFEPVSATGVAAERVKGTATYR